MFHLAHSRGLEDYRPAFSSGNKDPSMGHWSPSLRVVALEDVDMLMPRPFADVLLALLYLGHISVGVGFIGIGIGIGEAEAVLGQVAQLAIAVASVAEEEVQEGSFGIPGKPGFDLARLPFNAFW